MSDASALLTALDGGLVVSCQPVPGGPLDRPDIVAAFALAAEAGGARGVRIEGLANLRAVRAVTALPIVGLVKRIDPATPIIITATPLDVRELAEAGADIVAFDATIRPGRPATVAALAAAVRASGRLAMADCGSLADAEAAVRAGAAIVGTTLSGYTGGAVPDNPDLALVRRCAALDRPVFAEGRYRTLEEVRAARRAGAHAVVVGSAITRPEHITAWFAAAVADLARARGGLTVAAAPVLAIDLGGTKLAAALVDGARIVARRESPTDRQGNPSLWIEALARLVADWDGYATAGIAVTGLVREGRWQALNPGTLAIPDDFPLVERLQNRLGVPVLARNDAQAAAWGEFRFGSGRGAPSLFFVTISTGIGGGMVLDGRLIEGRAGLAGHLGVTPLDTPTGVRLLEDQASGAALDRLASDRGGGAAATAAALRREPWAVQLLDRVVAPLALALRRVQLVLDPDRIVVGGGLGLAHGYRDVLERHLEAGPPLARPTIRAAALGADAGLIGIADLAITSAGGQA